MIYYIFMLSVEGNLYAMLCNVIYLNAQMKDRVMPMKLTREKMEEIEKITNNITNKIDFTNTCAVDITPIVEGDGFQVIPMKMNIDITGSLYVDDNNKKNCKIITVNTQFTSNGYEEEIILKKSRFVTAHEYGHYVLHKKEGVPMFAHRDTEHKTDYNELEADYFARSILMPIDIFKIYYQISMEKTQNDIEYTTLLLSKVFVVTINKIKARIHDMDVLEMCNG